MRYPGRRMARSLKEILLVESFIGQTHHRQANSDLLVFFKTQGRSKTNNCTDIYFWLNFRFMLFGKAFSNAPVRRPQDDEAGIIQSGKEPSFGYRMCEIERVSSSGIVRQRRWCDGVRCSAQRRPTQQNRDRCLHSSSEGMAWASSKDAT